MQIDIRNEEAKVSEIVFADQGNYVASKLVFEGSYISLLDEDGDTATTGIDLDDIDNLIKALKRAKETWC